MIHAEINDSNVLPSRPEAVPPALTNSHLFSLPLEEIYSPLSPLPSAHDYQITSYNRAPSHLTSRLRELVPLLNILDFKLESVTDNETVGTVPLLASTMNQNGTHQASVFYIMADYVSGTAVYAACAGTYMVGLHDRVKGQPIQMWLKSNAVQHLKPGTGSLRGKAFISDAEILEMRNRLLLKGRCEIPMNVDIYQGNDLVATAQPVIGVYIDNPRFQDKAPDFFQRENSKLSAKMIAGIRTDADSQAVAGEQGRALALRFAEVTPQLPHMIEARGLHLKQHLTDHGDRYAQVVVLGLGLDTIPLHHAQPGQQWYGLDLRQTLQVRKEQFQSVGGDAPTLKLVTADLRLHKWPQALLDAGYDPACSTLFIMEGFTPYLHAPELERLLSAIHELCQHPKSQLWFDHVTPELFRMEHPEVQGFFSAISRLGEPFVTGFKDVQALSDQWQMTEQCTAADMLNGRVISHPVYAEHLISLVAPAERQKSGKR